MTTKRYQIVDSGDAAAPHAVLDMQGTERRPGPRCIGRYVTIKRAKQAITDQIRRDNFIAQRKAR